MLKASPSGADKIQSFPDLQQILLYAALGSIVLAALFAPWLTDVSPLDQDLMNLDQPFSPAHPLGTDSLGRDILARLVYGARTTLEISLGGTFIAFFIGAGIGLTALSMGRFAAGVFFAFIDLVRALRGRLPIFGICLGHQMIALACGARTFKMKFGHRGGNHPVRELATGKIEITSQNHSLCGG